MRVDCPIVVLTYNRPGLLRHCLDSIVSLEKEDISFEVIVVDDGSESDNSSVVADYEQSLNIRFYKRDHRGVAAARNFGIKCARGRLIAFIADDYRLPKGYLTDSVKFLERHREAFIITHNILPCSSSPFKYVQRLYFQLALFQSLEGLDTKADVLKSYSLPPSRGAVFRREIFELLGCFNEDLLTGEDGEFGMRMASKGIPIYFFPNKYIEHWEEKDLWGYLDQRLRYGASFARVLTARNAGLKRYTFFRVFVLICGRKYLSWLKLSWKMSRGVQYVLLSPFIVLFLLHFYWGFYTESGRGCVSDEGLQ